MRPPAFNIGVEEEFQIIDPETRELKSYITEILEEGRKILKDDIKPELHQSVIEVGTPVCKSIAEVRTELKRLRREIINLAGRHGLKIASAGTHPISSWKDQKITPLDRYVGVQNDMQMLANQLLIFGTHVHIEIPDRELMVETMNVTRTILPYLLCLSASSPFWEGRNTGLKSYRSIIFRGFPRTGIPRIFRSWGELDETVQSLIITGCIPDGTKIWWDIRPNWKYPTLEIRICDGCTRLDEVVCIAAIYHAFVFKFWKMQRDNMTYRAFPGPIIDENKWRAVRYGLDGDLADFGKLVQMPARKLIKEFIQRHLDDVLDELGTRKEVEYAFKILEEGTSADRQVRVFEETGDMKAVVDNLVKETAEGVF